MASTPCIICGSNSWLPLPDPSANLSVTTSGCFVEEAIGKSHCPQCGMVQRTAFRYLGLTDFYERNYNTYYERPGTQVFNSQRYREIAQWVSASLGGFVPRSIIEVGCGRGWTLKEIRQCFPDAEIAGIEPSIDNSEEARRSGFDVTTGKLDASTLPDRKFDLVFSNHVLQHTTDPLGFLQAAGELLTERGMIVITIQDASIPSNELLYSDQNFSFMPAHLVALGEAAGLRVLSWIPAPDTDGLKFSQLVIYSRPDSPHGLIGETRLPAVDALALERLYKKRVQYFEAWPRISEFLCWKTGKNRHVYNFGAGMYSYLLAAYCQDYWARVTACVVDGVTGEFAGKQVIASADLKPGEDDCVVMGTRPGVQRSLAGKLRMGGGEILCWDNFVDG